MPVGAIPQPLPAWRQEALLSVDVVLADGSFVTASSEEDPDLFWAVRGGGGNFGVVTSFEFQLHPVKMVHFGPTFWPLEEAANVLSAYRHFIVEAPGEVSGFFAFLVIPPPPNVPRVSPQRPNRTSAARPRRIAVDEPVLGDYPRVTLGLYRE